MAENNDYIRIFRNPSNPVAAWIPHEYLLKTAQAANVLPTSGVPAGSQAYTADLSVLRLFDGAHWRNAAADSGGGGTIPNPVSSLSGTPLAMGTVVEAVGIPLYLDDAALGGEDYAGYSLSETGWYVFARIAAKGGVTVDENTAVTGAAGYIAEFGADYVDVAVRFGVTAEAQTVTVDWGAYADTFIFRAPDLAVRNLDYRVTFHIYDADDYVTWEYALTTDETFQADANYYTLDGDSYTLAEVTAGDAVPADTYYKHSKIIISGLTRNITYKLDTIIDCPMEFILPEIEDDTYGCWFEIRCQHAGEYSMTLVPPSADVKVATEHTQRETVGINVIDLHYTSVNGVKLWRFLNTHSSIPA